MEDKREDVRELTKVLKKRLKWYQEEATEEEMDPEEISAILALLEKWEESEVPVPEVSDAYTAFCEHYLQAAGHSQPGKRKVYRILRQTAVAIIVVSVLFLVLNLGTYAAAGQSFFALLWQRDGEKSFAIMGGEDSSKEDLDISMSGDTYYSSWEELPQETLDRIFVPMYIPEELELSSLTYWGDGYTDMVRASYGFPEGKVILRFWIERYGDFYAWQQDMEEDTEGLVRQEIGGRDCYWQQRKDELLLYFFVGEELYTLQSNLPKQEIEKIAENMQKSVRDNR